MSKTYSVDEARRVLERYCAYQDRCHAEVTDKLRSIGMIPIVVDTITTELIQNGFLNEERFARSFARGKHRIKFWGKVRIVNELKLRDISSANIKLALQELSDDEYEKNFLQVSERAWNGITEKNVLKKRKKFCDYLLRKGFESALIYERAKELEAAGS